ncbi:MAG: metal-dependent hydrolase [Myxococcota bacterium]
MPYDRSSVRLRVRKMGFDFSEVPKKWFYDSIVVSHIANGLNLVFPAGEQFFVRSVRHFLKQIDDPALRTRIRGFAGQEASHGHEHEQAFKVLEAQGYEIRTWLAWYERVAFDQLEPRFPPVLRLSTTAAMEHFTATLAEQGLSTEFLDNAHPAMRDLLRWHAAEEIEHKSVAYDVLQHVDDRYVVRVAGLVVAAGLLMTFWRSATRMLLAQEDISKAQIAAERKAARARGQNNGFLLKAIASYLRPGFHPDQVDNDEMARDYLRSIGRLAS